MFFYFLMHKKKINYKQVFFIKIRRSENFTDVEFFQKVKSVFSSIVLNTLYLHAI